MCKRGTIVDQQTYILSFDEVSPDEASRYADELSSALLDATADITIQRRWDDPRAQDFGTTLVLILGAPTTAALAKTIATVISNWLALRKGTISVETDKGEITKITATNLTSEAQLKVLEILMEK